MREHCWNLAISNDRTEWLTTDSSETGQSVITSKTASPATPDYYDIGSTTTNGKRRFSYTINGTVSSQVGAAKGIPSATYTGDDDTTSILPVGTANVTQSTSSSDGYIFSECSSTQTGNLTWLSSAFTVSTIENGDRIRICYFGGGNGLDAAKGLQTTDSLYVRYIED